jgi:hypothetical protein
MWYRLKRDCFFALLMLFYAVLLVLGAIIQIMVSMPSAIVALAVFSGLYYYSVPESLEPEGC